MRMTLTCLLSVASRPRSTFITYTFPDVSPLQPLTLHLLTVYMQRPSRCQTIEAENAEELRRSTRQASRRRAECEMQTHEPRRRTLAPVPSVRLNAPEALLQQAEQHRRIRRSALRGGGEGSPERTRRRPQNDENVLPTAQRDGSAIDKYPRNTVRLRRQTPLRTTLTLHV